MTQVFCKWKFLLGSIGVLGGLRDAGQQRQHLLLCRELCLALSSIDPWYIHGWRVPIHTSEGGVYHYLFGEKAVPRGLRQVGGVPQIEYVYPDLLKRFKVASADTYLPKSKPLKAVCKLEHLHKKKTFKTCISCRHWLLLFIHWLKLSTFFWKVWGYYFTFIAFVSNFRGRDSFLCFIIFKGAERTSKSELLIFFFFNMSAFG